MDRQEKKGSCRKKKLQKKKKNDLINFEKGIHSLKKGWLKAPWIEILFLGSKDSIWLSRSAPSGGNLSQISLTNPDGSNLGSFSSSPNLFKEEKYDGSSGVPKTFRIAFSWSMQGSWIVLSLGNMGLPWIISAKMHPMLHISTVAA